MNATLLRKFGGIVRVRCMGIVFTDAKMLLVKHAGLNKENIYWMPPGGGLEKGESIVDCLYRELSEETGLSAVESSYISCEEFIGKEIHAIELFFLVKTLNGDTELGTDPELDSNDQIIGELCWMTAQDILNLDDQFVHPFIKKLAKQINKR